MQEIFTDETFLAGVQHIYRGRNSSMGEVFLQSQLAAESQLAFATSKAITRSIREIVHLGLPLFSVLAINFGLRKRMPDLGSGNF
ncbi:hypothetical protein LOC67_12255 [Stieleria sp. JC731]|uniref:hypothetical protein n=1 Tax=Pirellulaceae TaxID=2691357 RepID=UPI001E4CD32F|nr:hypothetical protein [Stieleria sp. JC731]MCC9601320.1 hypothetical protein [Stieleria sp. JC731]